MGPKTSVCLNCSPPSEWPFCCTRLEPPTAMDLRVQNMRLSRRGMDTQCPWETRVSGLPLCMCWEISFRALGSWPPPSSSTSRYHNGGISVSLPYLHPLPPGTRCLPHPLPGPLPALGCVSFPLCKSSRVPSGCEEPPLSRHCFFVSPASVQGS